MKSKAVLIILCCLLSAAMICKGQNFQVESSEWTVIEECENFCGSCEKTVGETYSDMRTETVSNTYVKSKMIVNVSIDNFFIGNYEIYKKISTCEGKIYTTDIQYLHVGESFTIDFPKQHYFDNSALELIKKDALAYFKEGKKRLDKEGIEAFLSKIGDKEMADMTPSNITFDEISQSLWYSPYLIRAISFYKNKMYLNEDGLVAGFSEKNKIVSVIEIEEKTKTTFYSFIKENENYFMFIKKNNNKPMKTQIFKYQEKGSFRNEANGILTPQGKELAAIDGGRIKFSDGIKGLLDCGYCYWEGRIYRENDTLIKSVEYNNIEKNIIFKCNKKNGTLQWESEIISNQIPVSTEYCQGCEFYNRSSIGAYIGGLTKMFCITSKVSGGYIAEFKKISNNNTTEIQTESNVVFNPSLTYGTMSDQDGNSYKTIKIGNQIWMAENLRTTKYRNGDPIPEVTGNSDWGTLTTGAYCNYNNTLENAKIIVYGRLYNWYTVADSRNIAPKGWHVPTDGEWAILINFLGESVAGGHMKEIGTNHWNSPNTSATNNSGFSATPAGDRFARDVPFAALGKVVHYWSSTQSDANKAWNIYPHFERVKCTRLDHDKRYGFSVRLVKD